MNDTTTDAATIFAPIWKRKWVILAVGLLVAVGTYLYYKHKHPTYTAATQLYLGGTAEQAGTGAPGQGKGLSSHQLADQVGVINSAIIGEAVRKRLRAEHDLVAAKGKVKASSAASGEFITIKTEAKKARAAVALADAYARAYIKRQRASYIRNIQLQIVNTTAQLHRVELPPPTAGKGKGAKGAGSASSTIQEANLANKINLLESDLASYTGVQQVGKATAKAQASSPKQNAIFGFVVGLVLAAIAAYVASRLDRRLRALGDVEAIFQTQILAALPSVRAPVVRPDGRRAPARSLLEPLRRLQTTLALGDMLEHRRDRRPRTILFLSPDAGDGKSTLIANLARVQAEAGERVVVVEADFRRPSQARLLDVTGQYGLADVLGGKMGVEEAIQQVSASAPAVGLGGEADGAVGGVGGVSTVVESSGVGSVSVLVGGGAVANPPALLAGERMGDLLRSMSDEFDYVLVDVPPPLEVSDAIALLPLVDGIAMVARVGHTRDVSARRLAQLLGRTASAPLLGAVVNCVPRKDIERYGFAWATSGPGRGRRLIGR